jgi:hypothetical protein
VRVHDRLSVPRLFPDPAEQAAAGQYLITRERERVGVNGHVGVNGAGAGPVDMGRFGRPALRVV